ncbi:MAG: hypothetical protein V1767_00745 [Chloroflexota bacterium]
MLIKVEKLRNALKMLEPAISKRTTIPITQSVLLKEGKIMATDLETAVIINLDEATEPCLLPFDSVFKIINLIPGTDDLNIEVGKKEVNLSWNGGKASYPTADFRDYPEIEKFDAPVIYGDINGNVLINAISPMVKYAAKETSRPILCAVHLLLGEKVIAAAADGFRLVYQELPISLGKKDDTISLNLRTIQILEHAWKLDPVTAPAGKTIFDIATAQRKMTIGIGNAKTEAHQWTGFRFGNVKILATLVAGTPPAFAGLIPKTTVTVKVMASSLKQATMRTKDVAVAGSDIVRLKWTDKEMDVYAKKEEMGEVSASIPIYAVDGPGHVAINVKYLLEYLGGKEGLVTMGMANNTGTGPILFEHAGAPATVLMSMLVAW